jgi:hypothetical protein
MCMIVVELFRWEVTAADIWGISKQETVDRLHVVFCFDILRNQID